MPNERDISEAILVGIIGFAFIFFELSRSGSLYNSSWVLMMTILYVIVGLFRVYGILLESGFLKDFSMWFFKSIVVQFSVFSLPIIIISSIFPPENADTYSFQFLVSIIISYSIVILASFVRYGYIAIKRKNGEYHFKFYYKKLIRNIINKIIKQFKKIRKKISKILEILCG